MRKAMAALAMAMLATASAGLAQNGDLYSGKRRLGEVWVYPAMFEQALAPLAPLAARAIKGGLCPGFQLGPDNLVHEYAFEAKLKAKGRALERRWEVEDLRILNASACPALDKEVTARMREAIPAFAEPREDSDGNGWIKIPRIALRLTGQQ